MKKFKIRFYLTTGGALEVVIEAKNDGAAKEIVKAQYRSTFKGFANSQEIR